MSPLRGQKALLYDWAKQMAKWVAITDRRLWCVEAVTVLCNLWSIFTHDGECLTIYQHLCPKEAGSCILHQLCAFCDLQGNPPNLTHRLFPSQHLFCAQLHELPQPTGKRTDRMDVKMQPEHEEEKSVIGTSRFPTNRHWVKGTVLLPPVWMHQWQQHCTFRVYVFKEVLNALLLAFLVCQIRMFTKKKAGGENACFTWKMCIWYQELFYGGSE